MAWLLLAAVAGLVGLGLAARRRARRRAIDDLRAAWGAPLHRERRLDAMLASHHARLAACGGSSLDDRTWADLDFDAVFAAIDRTASTVGQHALYHRLRTIPGDRLQAFDALATRFGEDDGLREHAQIALARLQDPNGYDLWWLGAEDAVEIQWWYVAFPLLALAAALLIGVTISAPQYAPALVVLLLVNVAVRYATDARIGALAAAFRQIAPVVATAASLRMIKGDAIAPITGALQSDVPGLRRLERLARWVSGNPLMLSVDAGPAAVMVNDVLTGVYEYLNLAFLLDGNAVFFGARRLRTHRAALLRVLAAMGDVDAAISVASLREGTPQWTRPEFLPPGSPAELADIRHPLLDEAVPNTTELVPGFGLLITGSNMSGKSTFLRTVGVNAVLAQTVYTCLASRYAASVFAVRSCIGRADDLVSGRSYYIAEVEQLLDLVTASSSSAPHLFLLDELFRGTNAVERIAAGRAVLIELLTKPEGTAPHVVLAATHDGELVDLLPGRYRAYHFSDAVTADGLVFDHRLRAGRATTRNAIALLELNGAPAALIRRAVDCAAMLDAQRSAPITKPR